uniref:Uncharacterized protein n=1 Tax=Zooxanthella nutricula TaxID=1333877 RepID=A0A7S2PBM1_9DINO
MPSRAALFSLYLVGRLAAGGASPTPRSPSTPLVTTDFIFGTYELVYDIYVSAWDKAGMGGLLAAVPVDKVKDEFNKQWAALPPDVSKMLGEAQTQTVQVKALALEYADKAYEPANAFAVGLIRQFEAFAPQHKGLIRHSLGDLAIFMVYAFMIVYFAVKVALFILRIALAVFCCLCCCGCCRRGKAAPKGNVAAKVKAKSAAAATPPSSGKAAAKATTKKAAAKK